MKLATLKLGGARPGATAARGRSRLVVHNRSLWSLQPDPRWSYSNPDAAKKLTSVDLTDAIGKKRMCSMGTYDDHLGDCDEVINIQHGGVHVVFEAEGASNPLDSPSILYVTDVDSHCAVSVDGTKIEQGRRVQLKPGAVIQCGEDVCFQVLRNVFAHA